jgi:hypothetical protein
VEVLLGAKKRKIGEKEENGGEGGEWRRMEEKEESA